MKGLKLIRQRDFSVDKLNVFVKPNEQRLSLLRLCHVEKTYVFILTIRQKMFMKMIASQYRNDAWGIPFTHKQSTRTRHKTE